MKKTLTAVALATSSILPLSNTANAEADKNLNTLDDNNTNQIDLKEKSSIEINKGSLSATVLKESGYLLDKNGQKVKSIKKGDKLQILKKMSNEPFTKVNYNGEVLYIANEFITNIEVDSTSGTDFKLNASGKVVNVQSNDTLNVRTSDNANSSTLFTLKPNTSVTVTERTNNGWYKISYYGNTGYINSKYIELSNTEVVETSFSSYAQVLSNISAKDLPYSDSKSAFDIPVNSGVNVVAKVSNNWYKITYYGKTGYVSANNINLISNRSIIKASFTVTNLSMNGVVCNVASNDVLNIRETPDASGKLITTLKNNAQVTITGLTSNDWYRVNINGKVGYANKKYIKEYVPTTTKFKVINTAIKLRNSASWSADGTDVANVGTILNVISISDGWASVYKDGKVLFAPANYLQAVDTPPTVTPTPPVVESKPSFTVTNLSMNGVVYNVASNDVLNVRETPDATGKLITTLKNNDKVTVTGVTSNDWYRVNINGKVGYANKKYIKEYVPKTTKYTVINGAINLRTSASWTGTVYETIKVGTVLDVIEIKGDWATVYKDGKTLYAPTSYLKSNTNSSTTPPTVVPIPPVVEESKPSFTVTNLSMDGVVYNIASNDVLNIRETPDSSGKLITSLKNDTRVTVTGVTSNDWYRVNINGKVGYANKKYIKEYVPKTTKYTVVNGAINLRTSSSWSGTVYETVKVGTVLDVIEIKGDWASVYKDGKTLYAPASYLQSNTVTTPPTVTPTPPVVEESKPSFTVTNLNMNGVVYNVASNDVLNVRETPNTSGKLITSLKNDERVTVTGITSNDWYRVDINGKVGYANKKYIKEYVPKTTKYTVINGAINLRTSASWSGTVYETIKVGTVLDVIEIKGDWASVYKDGKTLYAPASYLQSNTVTTPPTVTPTPPVVEESKPSFTVTNLNMDGVVYNVAYNDVLNIRETPDASGKLITSLKNDERVTVTGITSNDWYRVSIDGKVGYANKKYIKEYTPENAPAGNEIYTNYGVSLSTYIKSQVKANPSYNETYFEGYINPTKCNKFEFLRLDVFRNLDVNKLNSTLSALNSGVLVGKGQAFLDTAKKYSIDPLYFIAQSIHETGYGKSTLAKGVTITEIANTNKPIKDSNGNITGYEMIKLPSAVTVYNLYGIGAYDNLPTMPNRALILGTTYAYNKGWTSVEKAIDGAGEFVSSGYIHSSKYNQNTLYKIRFNPNSTYIWHQYATTPWYSRDIAKFMEKYQDLYTTNNFTYDKPMFTGMSEYSLASIATRSLDLNSFYLKGKEDITLK